MKKIILNTLICLFVMFHATAQTTRIYKFSNRHNPEIVEFLYLDDVKNPTKISYRASSQTKNTDLEITKKLDEDGKMSVKFPKKKITWILKFNASFITVINEKNVTHTYSLEDGFIYQDEKIYVQYSVAGIGAFYYMPSSQIPPKELKVIKEYESAGQFYDVVFPNNGGKATISFDKENNMIVKKNNGTTKVFLRKN